MNTNKTLWIDFIRVVAIFFVVWLHSAGPLLYEYNKTSSFNWWTGNIYDSLVRTCVPLFFMTSGYLLLSKREPLGIYFAKRVNKILIPFLVWSILYILWGHYFYGAENITFHSLIKIFLVPSFFHLWFLYVLLGLYLYTPLLRIFIQNAPQEYLYYFVALWYFAVSVLPLIQRITHITSIIDLKMISGYVGYLVLGYLAGNANVNKQQFVFALGVALVCACITILGTAFFTIKHHGQYEGYFYDYLSLNVIIFSVMTFVVLKYLFEAMTISAWQATILQKISSASFGIYLIHPIIMGILSDRFSLNVVSIPALYSVPTMAMLTFGIALVITVFLQRIPLIQKIVP